MGKPVGNRLNYMYEEELVGVVGAFETAGKLTGDTLKALAAEILRYLSIAISSIVYLSIFHRLSIL